MSNSKNILYLISLMLLMLTGCEADTSWAPLPGEGEEPVEVRLHATTLGASVEVTRASGDTIQLPENTQVGMTGGTYQNLSLTYDDNTRALKRTDQDKIYYPLQTDTMHIYAYAPFKEEAYIYEEDSVLIRSDWETLQNSSSYITNPIWANASVTKDNPTDTLTFKHAMSRLQICLIDSVNVNYKEHYIELILDRPQHGKMSMKTGKIKSNAKGEGNYYTYADSYKIIHELGESTTDPYYTHTLIPGSEVKRISVRFTNENNDSIYEYNYPEKDFITGRKWIDFQPGKTYKIVINFGKITGVPRINGLLEDFEFDNEDEIYI